jgi:hypothetical protein
MPPARGKDLVSANAFDTLLFAILSGHFISNFAQLQILINFCNFIGRAGVAWQRMYESDNKGEVDTLCGSMGIQTKWRDDGSLCTFRTASATRTHPVTGREVWFNHSHLFHTSDLPERTQAALSSIYPSSDYYPKNCLFADGSEIPLEYLDSVRKAQVESTVSWDWQKGDLILLENFVLCHGRSKYSPTALPKRRVLASMLF